MTMVQEGSGDAAADCRSDDAQFGHQLSERSWIERLRSVGERVVGIVMHFDEQAVGSSGDRSAGHRRNFVAASGAMRRIGPHRQVRKFLDHRNRRQIKGVARPRSHRMTL